MPSADATPTPAAAQPAAPTPSAVAALSAAHAADNLPDDTALLKALVRELLATLTEERRDKAELRERLDRLLRRLYGPRSERYDANQPLLFPELAEPQASEPATPPATELATETTAKPARRTARPHGRRRLPDHLPREPRHHELTEAERLCPDCGQLRIDIGADQSSQLEYRPASLFVIEHFTHKYACPCCSQGAACSPDEESPGVTPGRREVDSAASGDRDWEAGTHVDPQADAAAPLGFHARPPLDAEILVEPSGNGNEHGGADTPALVDASSPKSADNPVETAAQTPTTADAVAPRGVVVSASKPDLPIAKGLPGPGLLAHLIVSKCVDHLPLHRLERIYERQGYFLPRSTTCDWLAACADLLKPLYQHLVDIVLQSAVIHTDDTPVKMQLANRMLATARLWTYLGDATHPYTVFDFTPNRKREGPHNFLANFRGYLQADAFSGYDGLYLPRPLDGKARIVEVACNAHARRKFYEARSSDAVRSHQALAYYRQLYELERRAKELAFDEGQCLRMRQDLAVPILEQFRQWLDGQRRDVLPKSPLGEALGYALNNWTALVRYTEAGCLAIDNNAAEREMKKVAIGRKNWLFAGSEKGGHTLAVLLSFTSSCQRLRVEPWAYLRDVLTRLPTTPADRLGELLPERWQKSSAPESSSPESMPS